MSLSMKSVALAVLLTASTLFGACLASDEGSDMVGDCEPEMPPNVDPNGTMVALQMHQWIWIENLTAPDWGPRTESGRLYYEFLRPGLIRNETLRLFGMPFEISINVSYVTDGDTLCTAALTEYRNRTSEDTDSTTCSRMCHSNFTTKGTQANLPLLVLDDWTEMTRKNVYLAFDAVDPDSRASYKCMGTIWHDYMTNLPKLLDKEIQCLPGDECLFNYDSTTDSIDSGCKFIFPELSWCVSDVEICEYSSAYNINGKCPVCCKGDFCNKQVAQKLYQQWLHGFSTARPRQTTTKAVANTLPSLWALAVCALSYSIALQQSRE